MSSALRTSASKVSFRPFGRAPHRLAALLEEEAKRSTEIRIALGAAFERVAYVRTCLTDL